MSVSIKRITIKTTLDVLIPKWYLDEDPEYLEKTKRFFREMGYTLKKQDELKKFFVLSFERGDQ